MFAKSLFILSYKPQQILFPLLLRSAVETKSPLSPPVGGPSSVSVMSYEGTVIAENRSKQQRASQSSRTSQSSPSSVNMSKEKGTNVQSLLPSKPSAPSQRSSSVAPSDQSSRGRKLPSKNVFVPGIGWASQVRTLFAMFFWAALRQLAVNPLKFEPSI